MKKIGLGILFILTLAIFAVGVHAEDAVVINSKNWQDVYNGLVYANMLKKSASFITTYDQGIDLINLLDKSKTNILLIESSDNKVIYDYGSNLRSKGFTVETLQGTTTQINLQLAKRSGATRFFVLDDAFGYNAIAIGGYCVASQSMPIFANNKNYGEVKSFLQTVSNPRVTSYGRVDREVKATIAPYLTETINKGNKFLNNIEVFKKHLSLSGRNQIVMTDGGVIEAEILSGMDPVMLVGETEVPADVIQMIKDANIKVGVAIGTNIFGNAKTIKDATGIKTLVKFGQGRNQVEYPLDTVVLPSFEYLLDITHVEYNLITQKLTLTFSNPSTRNFLIFKGDYNILSQDKSIATTGDNDSVYVSQDGTITTTYDNINLVDYANKDLTLQAQVLMGEDTGALEYVLKKDVPITFSKFDDSSDIQIVSAKYNQYAKRFEIQIKNTGSVEVYTRAQINDFLIAGEKNTLSSTGDPVKLAPGETKDIKIVSPQGLEQSDFDDNPLIHGKSYYGQRADVLIKSKLFDLKYDVVSGRGLSTGILGAFLGVFGTMQWYYWVIVFIIVIVLIWLILLLLRRRKNEGSGSSRVTGKVSSNIS